MARLRRWLIRGSLALLVVLIAVAAWIYFVYAWVFFVKPGDGGPHQGLAIEVVAGSEEGEAGFADGRGPQARMDKPIRLAVLDERTLVFADIRNHAVRTIDDGGEVRTLAGGPGLRGHRDGSAGQAMFRSPHGVAVRADGVIAVSEASGHTIRLLTPAGDGYVVSTLAGVPGRKGHRNGPAGEARFNSPHAVIWAPDGSLYVADIGNSVVRRIKEGLVEDLAGTGRRGKADGPEGTLAWPMDLALDGVGGLWIADAGTLMLRRWDEHYGLQTPFPEVRIAMPHGLAVLPDGQVAVAEMNGQRILAFDRSGSVQTLCGNTSVRGRGQGELNRPADVVYHRGWLWIADLYNHRIVRISPIRPRAVR